MKKLNAGTDTTRWLFEEATRLLMEHLPTIKRFGAESIEFVFVPQALTKQLVLAIVLQTGAITGQQIRRILLHIISHLSSKARMARQLLAQQSRAATQQEWTALANQIDAIQGNDAWRADPSCALYESDRISARIDEFVHLMRRSDIFDLMFTLRGGISRARFGLLHEGLFSKAMAGTKTLVETYHSMVCASLDFVCDNPVPSGEQPIPTDARLAFFNETRHSYGRTAFLLSGGAALGFYHMGVAKALLMNGLLPRVISGASAGSICCAMIATRTDKECLEDLFNVRGTHAPGHSGTLALDFFRPVGYGNEVAKRKNQTDVVNMMHNTAGALQDRKRLWQGIAPQGLRAFTSYVYDILVGHRRAKDLLMNDTVHFKMCLRKNIGNFTFQEAFDRTGRILNITVSPQNKSDPPRLLNYLTAPHVLVWSAAAASASLPGVFKASKLLVKDSDGTERYESASGLRFQDGSMEADLPMEQLSEMFNVNHFIISQVNPHAYMFASFSLSRSVWTHPILGFANGILTFVKNQVKAWVRNMIELIGGRRIAPLWDTRRGFFSQFFIQEYEGREIDITINPWGSHLSIFSAFMYLIYNPTPEEFLSWTEAAERETWKHIPAIRSHCAVEMTLDRCVQRLRKRIVEESYGAHYATNGVNGCIDKESMGNRLPSFFQSPSLVNMGGLGVADQYLHCESMSPRQASGDRLTSSHASLNGLTRTQSDASGIFVDDMSDGGGSVQRAGSSSNSLARSESAGYIKTTHMADFYYRKNKSIGELSEAAFYEPIPDNSVHNFPVNKARWLGNAMVSLDGAAPS